MRLSNLFVPSLLVLPFAACQAPEDPQGSQVGQANGLDARSLIENQGAQPQSANAGLAAAAVAPFAEPLRPRRVEVLPTPAPYKQQEARAALVSAPAQDGLDQEVDRVRLTRDRARALSGEAVKLGNEFFAQGRLEEAQLQFARAVNLDHGNVAAREGLQSVNALLGDAIASGQEVLRDAADREAVRQAEAYLAAEAATSQGDALVRAGDPEAAIARYKEAELILSIHPLISNEDLDLTLVRGKLAAATEASDLKTLADEVQARAEADQARQDAEQKRRDYRANALQKIYRRAQVAFDEERYEDAVDFAKQILVQDPGNEMAIAMRDIAQAAHFRKRDFELRTQYRENWIRTIEELEQSALPQSLDSPLIFDDLDRWREVRERKPYEFRSADGGVDPEVAQIRQTLATQRVNARFGVDGEGAPLESVADYLSTATGIDFMISPSVFEEIDEEDSAVLLDLNERSVSSVLNLIAETTEGLDWKIENGVVKFVTSEELVGDLRFVVYEVRDLVKPPQDFAGPEIDVLPSEGIEYIEEDPREPDAAVITGDDLVALIEENVAPETWGDPGSIESTDTGTMVVFQTQEVHDQISSLLEDLREAAGIMVQIQTRFLKVEDNFLEDIGVDFRGLGTPGLGDNQFFNDFGAPGSLNESIGNATDTGLFYDNGENGDVKARVENLFDTDLGGEITGSGGLSLQWTYLNDLQLELVLRAVSKSERVEVVTAPSILVFNTARSHIKVLNQLTFVQDYNVQIATAAAIADPIVQVVQDGVVLDVRPVVSADRRSITLDLRPTVATLTRPIQEFSTSLATSGGTVTIQLPELELQKLRTVVTVPDGNQKLASGTPILNKIPILSFFFDRKGSYVSNQKTLVLLKSTVVLQEELEPSDAQLGLTLTDAR
jgi:tetratricopeptide (TPR) repeat protein